MNYRVRVRSKTYLWGGPGIGVKLHDLVPVYLTVRNDELGEAVTIGREERHTDNTVEQKPYGLLARGQTYTMHLSNVASVYAEQKDGLPTTISCEIHGR
jgi:hypothetical protein